MGYTRSSYISLTLTRPIGFFEKIFLIANISPEVVFELILSSANVDFLDWKL